MTFSLSFRTSAARLGGVGPLARSGVSGGSPWEVFPVTVRADGSVRCEGVPKAIRLGTRLSRTFSGAARGGSSEAGEVSSVVGVEQPREAAALNREARDAAVGG